VIAVKMVEKRRAQAQQRAANNPAT
jgi:hypothetical protein